MEIATHGYSVPHRILGFGGRTPNISNLLVLVDQTMEIAAFTSSCNIMRRRSLAVVDGIWRPVWFTPLWEELLQFGLLLYKMLSLSGSIMERLEQLPGPFHALLRFTSIIASDMIRARFAPRHGEAAVMRMRRILRSGWAPGDKAPWLLNDICWRGMEIFPFEHGCTQFLQLMTLDPTDRIGRSQSGGESLFDVLRSGTLPQDRRYHLRLDDLCPAYGRAWGGPEFGGASTHSDRKTPGFLGLLRWKRW